MPSSKYKSSHNIFTTMEWRETFMNYRWGNWDSRVRVLCPCPTFSEGCSQDSPCGGLAPQLTSQSTLVNSVEFTFIHCPEHLCSLNNLPSQSLISIYFIQCILLDDILEVLFFRLIKNQVLQVLSRISFSPSLPLNLSSLSLLPKVSTWT